MRKILFPTLFAATLFLANIATTKTESASKTATNKKAVSAKQLQCEVYGYVIDKDPKGLNVRSAPNGKASIVGKLNKGESGIEVTVIGSSNKWLQIKDAQSPDNDAKELYEGMGWVYAAMIGTSTRGYDTGKVKLYKSPDKKGGTVGTIPKETEVKLTGCRDSWAKVGYKGKQGWLARDDQCGASMTTCP